MELVLWCFQDKLVLGSYLVKLKNVEQSGVKTYICWNRLFGKLKTQQTGASSFSLSRWDIPFSLLCGEGRVELSLPLLALHCIKYKISPNFVVWKFCGNAKFPQKFPQVSGE